MIFGYYLPSKTIARTDGSENDEVSRYRTTLFDS